MASLFLQHELHDFVKKYIYIDLHLFVRTTIKCRPFYQHAAIKYATRFSQELFFHLNMIYIYKNLKQFSFRLTQQKIFLFFQWHLLSLYIINLFCDLFLLSAPFTKHSDRFKPALKVVRVKLQILALVKVLQRRVLGTIPRLTVRVGEGESEAPRWLDHCRHLLWGRETH